MSAVFLKIFPFVKKYKNVIKIIKLNYLKQINILKF